MSTYSVKPITGTSDVIQLSKITHPTRDTSVAIQRNMVCCETLLEVHIRHHVQCLWIDCCDCFKHCLSNMQHLLEETATYQYLGEPSSNVCNHFFFGVFLLLPTLILKFVVTQDIRLEGSMISAVSHFTYNVASITVLQSVSLLTHAILNLAKKVVIVANIVYFHTPVSFSMSIGRLVFFFSLFLYYVTVNAHSVVVSKCSQCGDTQYVSVSIFTIVCILSAIQCSFRSLYQQPLQSHYLSSKKKSLLHGYMNNQYHAKSLLTSKL